MTQGGWHLAVAGSGAPAPMTTILRGQETEAGFMLFA
jgi:hypothetical protein